jgi:hypothetical protein
MLRSPSTELAAKTVAMPSLQELHTAAGVNKLPIEDFEDMSLVYSTVTKRQLATRLPSRWTIRRAIVLDFLEPFRPDRNLFSRRSGGTVRTLFYACGIDMCGSRKCESLALQLLKWPQRPL